MAIDEQLDAVIVGAGFGGVYLLKQLRDRGFKVKLLEMGSDFGGVWYCPPPILAKSHTVLIVR